MAVKKKPKSILKKKATVGRTKKTKPLARKKVVVKKSIKKPTATKRKSKIKSRITQGLDRYEGNPILAPSRNYWESKAPFNPSAVVHNNKVHIVYRAIGEGDVSMLGYATSADGLHIDERFDRPCYVVSNQKLTSHVEYKIPYSSGGGWNGGCEDPRMVIIGDRAYLIYTAFDGWGSLRIALTSIALRDFEEQRWNWKKPVLISPPNEIHKNWVLFPEKINGKFAILHSISPNVLVDYFGSLDELDGATFIKSAHQSRVKGKKIWHDAVRGVGPSPIKTDRGWLVLYHATEDKDPHQYKLGALLLDLKDPTKVLYRSVEPILAPEEVYENEGFKSGVVYTCGAVVRDGELFVYYGGADAVCCVATINLEQFLQELVTKGVSYVTKRSNVRR